MSDVDGGDKPNDEPGLAIEELAERFGLSVRAVRFYIAQGLLPGPGSRGKAATYGEEHVVRLGLIRLLIDRHMPLAKIQALLQGLTLDEVKALYEAEQHLTTQLAQAEGQSPQSYVATLLEDARRARHLPQSWSSPDTAHMPSPKARQSPPRSPAAAPTAGGVRESDLANGGAEPWSRWTLAPGVELHVSASARARYDELLDALLRLARERAERRGDKGD